MGGALKSEQCIAFIFARGGSKGVPRKNIKPLAGLPLIAYSIQTALACPSIDRVLVSTDDEEIAAVAREHGAEVPFLRPAYLAEDGSSELDAWKHAIAHVESEYAEGWQGMFVSLPPTSPLRSVEDVESCIKLYRCSDADMVVTVKEAARSPYFNMLYEDDNGHCHLVNRMSDGSRYVRRQDVPEVFDMTTVAYVSSPAFVNMTGSVLDGKVRQVLIPDERAVDIDTMTDFKFAEFLAAQRKTGN